MGGFVEIFFRVVRGVGDIIWRCGVVEVLVMVNGGYEKFADILLFFLFLRRVVVIVEVVFVFLEIL